MCGFTPGADLVTWAEFESERSAFEADLDAAATDVQTAHFAYEEALRRYRCAPHGTADRRRGDLRMANARILKAELDYALVKKREPHW